MRFLVRDSQPSLILQKLHSETVAVPLTSVFFPDCTEYVEIMLRRA
jgi:hypothetical protein